MGWNYGPIRAREAAAARSNVSGGSREMQKGRETFAALVDVAGQVPQVDIQMTYIYNYQDGDFDR